MGSTVVALGFEGESTAEGMLGSFEKMQEEGLIDVEDAVVASRGAGGHVEIKQTQSVTGKYTARGTGIGLLAGLLLGGPVGGLVGGAAVGAIAGSLKDFGIDDDFVRETSEWIRPDGSALFLMVSEAEGGQVLEKLRPFKAKVLSTSLAPDQEKRLRDALAEEQL